MVVKRRRDFGGARGGETAPWRGKQPEPTIDAMEEPKRVQHFGLLEDAMAVVGIVMSSTIAKSPLSKDGSSLIPTPMTVMIRASFLSEASSGLDFMEYGSCADFVYMPNPS